MPPTDFDVDHFLDLDLVPSRNHGSVSCPDCSVHQPLPSVVDLSQMPAVVVHNQQHQELPPSPTNDHEEADIVVPQITTQTPHTPTGVPIVAPKQDVAPKKKRGRRPDECVCMCFFVVSQYGYIPPPLFTPLNVFVSWLCALELGKYPRIQWTLIHL